MSENADEPREFINARGSQGFINRPAGPITQNFGTIINQLTQGIAELPTRYDARIKNFLEYYLGSPEHPAPFGGRQADLAALDAWLNDPGSPSYALLVAPAGRGKSALLAHCVTQLSENADGLGIVYFPISVRFNTNLQAVAFSSLAARLAHLYGEKVTQAYDAEQYRGVLSDFMRKAPPDGKRVLVVLDGLDEAAGWEAGADLFPYEPPPYLRVVVAARPLAGDRNEKAWLTRVGWDAPGRARVLELERLDLAGVRDVLAQMGNPLDRVAARFDIVSKLYELSEGDPLLVRLYIEALTARGDQAALFTPDELLELKPGLEDYFKRWFEEQRRLWGEKNPLGEKAVKGLLNLCALALGPLWQKDALRLASDYCEDSWTLEEAARAVNRLVIGDGINSGYVFSHPRLSEYFAGRLTRDEQKSWRERFLRYGKDTLTELVGGDLLPRETSHYVVQYYAAHLVNAHATCTEFYSLVCEPWLRAWEEVTGTPDGFLTDVRRAWDCANREGARGVGMQVRCALCFSSVASLSENIGTDLLINCVRYGVISLSLGLVLARSTPDPSKRTNSLAQIAELLPVEQQANIWSEALTTARAIRDEERRASALSDIASQLPEGERAAVFSEALTTARAIRDEERRASVLSDIASHLPEGERAAVFSEALTTARAIRDEDIPGSVLSGIASHLPASLLAEALTAARAITDEERRASVLSDIASHLPASLPEGERAAVFSEALTAARAMTDEYRRAFALEEFLASALSDIASHLPASLLAEALTTARAMTDEYRRASVLSRIASHLPEGERAAVFSEALTAARAITDEERRASVLSRIASHLPEGERAAVFSEALTAARAITSEPFRASVLSDIAKGSPIDELQQLVPEIRPLSGQNETIEILRLLVLNWSSICSQLGKSELDLMSEMLRIFSTGLRRQLLAAIDALAPIIEKVGGTRALSESAQAIIETAHWWK